MIEVPRVLELRGISKRFGSVPALRRADLVLTQGEIHGLLGENGAGKSTLMHVAYGMVMLDAGTIRVRGRDVTIRSPRDARALGLGMVHQHFTSIGAMSVRENLALARGRRPEPGDGWTTAGFLRGLNPAAAVETLSVALRQRLEIAKALATGADILLLDEPTAVLAPSEVEELLAQVKEFVRGGGSVVLITHKLAEVFAAADRVTVLRQGRVTLQGLVREQTEQGLAEAMIGRAADQVAGSPPTARPPDRLTAIPVVRIGPIAIRPGDLVGIAAIEGNGQREMLRRIAGTSAASGPFREALSVTGPVAFVPEDRTTEGLIPELSLTENFVLGQEADARWGRGPRLDWGAARSHTAQVLRGFRIQAPGPEVAAGVLSGGNQQKLMLARALTGMPRVLVAENPTRGLDLRATAEVQQRLRDAARAGVAVLVYSSDLDEVLALGERVLVVRAGRVSEAPAPLDRRVLGQLMLGIASER